MVKNKPAADRQESIAALDKVRSIILDNAARLHMDTWHIDETWRNRTCAEEAACETAHCLAGWLQVCSDDPEVRALDPQTAGSLCAPVAAKMFFKSGPEVLEWLKNRSYANEV